MTDIRLGQRTLQARVRLAERGTAPLGFLLVSTIVATRAVEGQVDEDVAAIEVGPSGHRTLHCRRPGETLRQLHDRVNPSGGLRARPVPIFRNELEGRSDFELYPEESTMFDGSPVPPHFSGLT